jgi:hypothetical protein
LVWIYFSRKNKSFRPRERGKKGLKNLQTVKTLAGRTQSYGCSNQQLGKARKQPLTVTAQFQQSLHSLMDTLNQANPFFIRCIKSNSHKVSSRVSNEAVSLCSHPKAWVIDELAILITLTLRFICISPNTPWNSPRYLLHIAEDFRAVICFLNHKSLKYKFFYFLQIPNKFDDETVQRQLRYTGMLETVRIRQAGYNVRLTYDEFIQLYRILLPKGLVRYVLCSCPWYHQNMPSLLSTVA